MADQSLVEIKRYPNRRYYDRSRAQYITLQDIEDLVLEGKTVEIRDSRTGEDMTRQVLTQILMDRHPQKMDLFPVDVLHSVLRANDMVMDLWRGYLRQALAAAQSWQKATNPFAAPVDWVSSLIPNFNPRPSSAADTEPPPEPPPGRGRGRGRQAPDPDLLARRLDELAARISHLEARPNGDGKPGQPPPPRDPISRLEERLDHLEVPETNEARPPRAVKARARKGRAGSK